MSITLITVHIKTHCWFASDFYSVWFPFLFDVSLRVRQQEAEVAAGIELRWGLPTETPKRDSQEDGSGLQSATKQTLVLFKSHQHFLSDGGG